MAQAKHGLRALVLCALAALGLMAFFAAGAQAEKGSAWMVNGKNLVGSTKVEISTDIKDTILLTTVGGTKVEILCELAKAKELTIENVEEAGRGKGTIVFEKGCVTRLNGSVSAVCKPAEPIEAKGLALLVLHKLEDGTIDDLLLIAPHVIGGVTQPFVRIKFSELCTLETTEGAGVPITGQIWLKDCLKQFLEEKLNHLLEQALVPKLGGLKFGVNDATLDGSINVFLASDLPWSGLWV